MSFPNPGLAIFQRDFSGGFLDTPEPDAIPLSASGDAANCLFATIGTDPLQVSLKKRDGHTLVNPSAMTLGQPVDGMTEFRRVGLNQVLLAACHGTLYDFDNADTFTSITTGFTAGNPMRFAFHKGQCIAMDGALMRRINTSLAAFPVGFAAPTAAPGLAKIAGPGVTGTYEGFATWYDSVTDHDSSPSAVSVQVVFANEIRHWTKPAGAPPANVTHWRVWVRRVDTNEANYFRAGSFTVASATGDESTSDAARTSIGPKPSENDPPPGAFALMGTFRGYAIGILPNDTSYYVSKVNDFESWNPSDLFRVANGRAELRVAKSFGQQFLLQTPVGTFTLEGDAVPFKIVEAHTNYGGVSQDATGEVSYQGGNRLYGWDESKGPYWWDGAGTWVALADNRIQRMLATVNKTALNKIRFVHDAKRHLVLWAVPVSTSERARTILPYDYTLDRWLPPITGLEVGAFAEFTNPATGTLAPYLGDLWGRVYQMFAQQSDGVPTASPPPSSTAAITGATASTLTCAGANFYTGGDGCAGFPVAVKSPAGTWQWRRIQSNTATTITLDTTNGSPWTTTPDASGDWTAYVGAIEWFWTTPWIDYGRPDRFKRLSYFTIAAKTYASDTAIEIFARYNDDAGVQGVVGTPSFEAPGGVWGTAIWGVDLWSTAPRRTRKVRANRACLTVQLRIQNYYPLQSVDITAFGVEADWLTRRRTIGAD